MSCTLQVYEQEHCSLESVVPCFLCCRLLLAKAEHFVRFIIYTMKGEAQEDDKKDTAQQGSTANKDEPFQSDVSASEGKKDLGDEEERLVGLARETEVKVGLTSTTSTGRSSSSRAEDTMPPSLRRDSIAADRSRSSTSTPGAYAIAPFFFTSRRNETAHSNHAPNTEQPDSASSSTTPPEQQQHLDSQTLAVAHPVAAEVHGLAVPVEIEPREHRPRTSTGFKSMRLGIGILLLITGVGTGTVLSVLLLSRPKAESQLEPSTTRLPIDAPALSMDQHVLSLLPDYTVHPLIHNPNSPQSKAFQWLLDDPSLSTYPDWRIQQRLALATFYYSTNGRRWLNNTRWMSYDQGECFWYNVFDETTTRRNLQGNPAILFASDPRVSEDPHVCNQDGTYRQLRLPNNNLRGSIPKEIALLTSLKSMLLFANPLTGTIPTEMVSNLKALEVLVLMGSQVAGALPSEIGLLSSLRGLGLLNNQLSGPLPSEMVGKRVLHLCLHFRNE